MKKLLSILLLIATIFAIYLVTVIFDVRKESKIDVEDVQQQENVAVLSNHHVLLEDVDYESALFEPVQGCYLGSYVRSNPFIEYSMDKFDALTGVNHHLSSTYVRAGDEVDMAFMLETMEGERTPYIIIYPGENSFSYEPIIDTLTSIGRYEEPVFISIYPAGKFYGAESDTYTSFFRASYLLAKELIPDVAVVWTIDLSYDGKENTHYPGDNYVDWVGLNMRIQQGEYEESLSRFNSLYEQFQINGPIILNELGVSSFYTKDYTYHVEEGIMALEQVYNTLLKYPRLKGINYINVHLTDKKSMDYVYAVTENEGLLNAYIKGTKELFVHNTLNKRRFKETYYSYKVPTLRYNGELYVKEGIFVDRMLEQSHLMSTLAYKNQIFFPIKDIEGLANYSIIESTDIRLSD